MTSAPVSAVSTTPDQVDLRRLPLAGLIALVAAMAANLVAFAILSAVLPLPEAFNPLKYGSIAFFTFLGMVGAVIAFWIVAKLSRRPIRTYRIVAVIALVLSVIPDIMGMANPTAFPFPDGSPLAFGVLIVFHIIAFAIAVVLLPRLTRPA